MATLIKPGITTQEIQPANGHHFTLKELQQLVGGWIELVPTIETEPRLMFINEEGRLQDLDINMEATRLYKWHSHDYIVGPAVLLTESEMAASEEAADYGE